MDRTWRGLGGQGGGMGRRAVWLGEGRMQTALVEQQLNNFFKSIIQNQSCPLATLGAKASPQGQAPWSHCVYMLL